MASTSIITTRWWADTAAQPAWSLLADAAQWPRWWQAVGRAEVATRSLTAAGRPMPAVGRPWRTALGWPLQLRVARIAAQPPAWLSLRLSGDLEGQATFTLQAARPHGVDLSCRCELSGPLAGGGWRARLIERRLLLALQALVLDMGRALRCRVRPLGTWRGSTRRP